MRSKYPWIRIIFGVIDAVFFCAALYLAIHSFVIYREATRISESARIAEPIRLDVDFSKPGEYSGSFHHTCGFACARMLRIETDTAFASVEKARGAMDGIAGTVQITDDSGTSVYERQFTSKDFPPFPDYGANNGFFPSLRIDWFKTGTYNFRLTVTEGAPALAGVGQALVARYILCSVEFMLPALLGLGSLLCFVIASIVLLAIIIVTRRERKKHLNSGVHPTP